MLKKVYQDYWWFRNNKSNSSPLFIFIAWFSFYAEARSSKNICEFSQFVISLFLFSLSLFPPFLSLYLSLFLLSFCSSIHQYHHCQEDSFEKIFYGRTNVTYRIRYVCPVNWLLQKLRHASINSNSRARPMSRKFMILVITSIVFP